MTIEPHASQPAQLAGASLEQASAAMLMLHGRGASAGDILSTLVPYLDHPAFTFIAPQAANHTWYPYGFMEPMEQNQPGIWSGLAVINILLTRLAESDIPPERVILLGFSQGACLSLEYAARHARRYGGIAGLSGGLIGPDGSPRDYPGSLAGTPIFLGCSDVDAHIPRARVEHTAEVLGQLGAAVDMRLYPGMGHTINQDEIEAIQTMMDDLAGNQTPP